MRFVTISKGRVSAQLGWIHLEEAQLKRKPARSKAAVEAHLTCFLSVDLDVFSRTSLEPLATAFTDRAVALHVARHANHFRGHFELHASPRAGPNALIAGLVRLVRELPPKARSVWKRAYRRDFNIGIQAGFAPHSFELLLDSDTLRLASSVSARIILTIYAAEAAGNAAAATQPHSDAETAMDHRPT